MTGSAAISRNGKIERNTPMTETPLEIPPEVRALAEKSVDQARKAFDGFIEAVRKTGDQAEGAANKLHVGAKEVGNKAVAFAEENVRAAFDHAEKLIHAKDPEEFLALQFDYVRNQMALIQDRAKELGSAIQNVVKPEK
jgi:phasin